MTEENSPTAPVVLCIAPGIGEAPNVEGNAVDQAATPTLDHLRKTALSTTLRVTNNTSAAAGKSLPCGHTGYMRIGSGRSVKTSREIIDEAIAEAKLAQAPMLDQTMRIALYDKAPMHLVGVLSDTGIHSSMDHLFTLIDYADFHEIPVLVHAILDGHDVPRRSAMGFIEALEGHMDGKDARLATLAGRDYAMDRNERWDRSYQVFHAMVRDKTLGPPAERAENAWEAVSAAYARGESDRGIEPLRLGDYNGFNGEFLCDFTAATPVWEWTGEDVGLAFNHRADGLRQLIALLSATGLPDEVRSDLLMDRHNPVRAFREHCFATLTDYGHELDVPVIMPSKPVSDTLCQLATMANRTLFRCTESEHASLLMRSFSGGNGEKFEHEVQQLFASPRLVDSYDEKPAMRSDKIARAVADALEEAKTDFVVASFANVDEVAHSGDMKATVAAVEALDHALATVMEAVEKAGAHLIVTSSHGNAEQMLNERGKPNPGHTTNPVPLFIAGNGIDEFHLHENGSIDDVAPTVLQLLGLPIPECMSGRSLMIASE